MRSFTIRPTWLQFPALSLTMEQWHCFPDQRLRIIMWPHSGVVRLSKVFKMLAWGSTPQKRTQSCLALTPCHHWGLCTCLHCWVLSPTSAGPQWHFYKHSWKGFGCHDSGLFPSQTEPLAPTQASLPSHRNPYFPFKLILFHTFSSPRLSKDIVLNSRSVLCPWEKVTTPLHQLNTPGISLPVNVKLEYR